MRLTCYPVQRKRTGPGASEEKRQFTDEKSRYVPYCAGKSFRFRKKQNVCDNSSPSDIGPQSNYLR